MTAHPSLHWRVGQGALALVQGDIATARVCAVVNAANARLAGGGGVDGAIHRAAGKENLQRACQKIIRERGPLEPGEAVVTPGFALPARWIIHTVGPVWRGGMHGEPEQLRSCYDASLLLASAQDCPGSPGSPGGPGDQDVAFPAVSCGVYGYPADLAARVALPALTAGLEAGLVREASLWLFSADLFAIFQAAATERLGPALEK